MKQSFIIILLLLLVSSILAVPIQPAGFGNEDDPYLIESVENLIWISCNPSSWSSYFLQTANIDASSTEGMNNEYGFSPIGRYDQNFTGNYSGQGYTISSLTIFRPNTDGTGLFGVCDGAEISGVYMTDADIWGNSYSGLLIGQCSSSIVEECSVIGTLKGSSYIGGLIGYSSTSLVQECYSSITCENDYNMSIGGLIGFSQANSISLCSSSSTLTYNYCYYVGGLVGEAYDTNISFSNSINTVTATAQVGGIVGFGQNTTINGCKNYGQINCSDGSGYFYDEGVGGIAGIFSGTIIYCQNHADVSGIVSVGGIVGALYGESRIENCCSTGNISGETRGVGGIVGYFEHANIINSHYNYDQVLINEEYNVSIGSLRNEMYEDWVDGGYQPLDVNNYLVWEERGYGIDSADDLHYMIAFNDHCFMLTSDIDLSDSPNLFIPLFSGRLDGNGHTIDNLTLSLDWQTNLGFIGILDKGIVGDLYLTNVDIEGEEAVGGLCAYMNEGSISMCMTSGVVCSNQITEFAGCPMSSGGLVGQAIDSGISDSFSRAVVVTTNDYTSGGLVGVIGDTSVRRCYSTGAIESTTRLGGLIGYARGVCDVTDSFWDTESSQVDTSNGGTGLSTLEMQTMSTFTDAGWHFGDNEYWAIDSNTNDGYPYLVHEPILANDDSVNPEVEIPFCTMSNYPNPFNPTTTISYTISKTSNVEISVYNVKGQKVRQLINEEKSSGTHSIVWNGDNDKGRNVTSGIYFCKMSSGGQTTTRKLILMK